MNDEVIDTSTATDQAVTAASSEPSPAVRALGRLVGTWRVTGGAPGTVTYEWLPGGHFLLQHLDLEQDGHPIRGLEVIGHLRPYGQEPSTDVHSRYYDSEGATLDYVYEMDGDTLRIWMGTKGSPAKFSGNFSAGDTVMVGAWEYPGGGGYASNMTRITTQYPPDGSGASVTSR